MFEHRYPGTDLHEIDLAYILGEIQALKYKLDNFVKENTFHLADPLDWNITTQYSACTIVRYNDDRLYLSAKPVPAGIQITNTEYWLNLIDCSGGGGGDYQEREVSFIPTETQQLLDVYPEAGYDALSKVRVIVQAISNLFVGSGIPRRSSSDLTASGAQVTAPSGYYENAAVKSVQAGTEGTPTATKGPVTNHAVAVTPAVTNTEGYIAGGTKTGSAVSVTAAELVSGTLAISQNGTFDVTQYASVNVIVEGGTTEMLLYHGTITEETASLEFSNLNLKSLTIVTKGLKTAKTSAMGALIDINPGETNGFSNGVLYFGNVFSQISSQGGYFRAYKTYTDNFLIEKSDPNFANNATTPGITRGIGNKGETLYPLELTEIHHIAIKPSEAAYPFTGGEYWIIGG